MASNRMSYLAAAIVGVVGIVFASAPASALPRIQSPLSVIPGEETTVEVLDFAPGGYTVTITLDGINPIDYFVPPGGSGVFDYPVPAGTHTGISVFSACANCGGGEFEQRAVRNILITSGNLEPGEKDAQVHAVEVTQGVRGEIPSRDIEDIFLLPSDPAVHVAGRHTIVRVYPTFDTGEAATALAMISATLTVDDGTDVLGVLTQGFYSSDILKSLEQRRSLSLHSSDFELPDEWVTPAPGVESVTLSFRAHVTLAGEAESVLWNNTAFLNDVEFRRVQGKPNSAFWLTPHFIRHRYERAPGDTAQNNADPSLLPTILGNMQEIMPIADGGRGVGLRGWRMVDWTGPLEVDGKQTFVEAMVRKYLPTGSLAGNPRHEYRGMFFRAGHCSGAGWPETPYFHVGVCGRPKYVVAHEITHSIGRHHAGNGHGEQDGGGYDAAYPDLHGAVELNSFGYDVYNRVPYGPVAALGAESERHDFMSYGPHQWTSRYTWNGITEALDSGDVGIQSRPAPTSFEEVFAMRGGASAGIFTGFVNSSTQEVELSPVVLNLNPGNPPSSGEFTVRFFDIQDFELGSQSVPAPALQDGTQSDWTFFSAQVNLPAGWTRMTFEQNGSELETFTRSASDPEVTLTQPTANFVWGETGTVQFSWTAQDPDQDPLTYRIIGLGDLTELAVIASDLTGNSYELDLDTLPAGGDWLFIVEASDGFRSGLSASVFGTAALKPPVVAIVHPRDGSVHSTDRQIHARGVFTDQQLAADQDPQQPITWYLDNNPVGDGDNIALGQLPEGSYELTAFFTNDFGLESSGLTNFTVMASLGAPALVSPSDGESSAPLPTVLEWQPIDYLSSYGLQIAADPDFEFVLVEQRAIWDTVYAFDADPDETYYWRVLAETGGLTSDWSAAWSFSTYEPASVGETSQSGRGLGVQLVPNPFSLDSSIVFRIPEATQVRVRIYDAAGTVVRRLFEGRRERGAHQLRWDGVNDQGVPTSNGVYFVEIRGAGLQERIRAVRTR